jgi:hypothetical protein
MGEKIKDIREITLGEKKLMLEKNVGTHKGSKYDIHIQDETFRLNLTETDFMRMASCILYAKENLLSYKTEASKSE